MYAFRPNRRTQRQTRADLASATTYILRLRRRRRLHPGRCRHAGRRLHAGRRRPSRKGRHRRISNRRSTLGIHRPRPRIERHHRRRTSRPRLWSPRPRRRLRAGDGQPSTTAGTTTGDHTTTSRTCRAWRRKTRPAIGRRGGRRPARCDGRRAVSTVSRHIRPVGGGRRRRQHSFGLTHRLGVRRAAHEENQRTRGGQPYPRTSAGRR